jgi:tetratricopeptide (TPR) repeat protein
MMISRAVSVVLLVGLMLGAVACSSAPPAKVDSAMVQTAQNMERRAAQSFARGEWAAAASTFESAAWVYETLALPEPQARARLSQARAVAEGGRVDQALTIVLNVIEQSGGLSNDTRAIAHGRAAALLMASDAASANRHVQDAMSACAGTCAQLSALTVLRARAQLASNQASEASATAGQALAVATNDNDRANALRLRAQAQAALSQHAAALADANQALVLDQALGLPERVMADLQLLQRASSALGDTAAAQRYDALLARARTAAAALAPRPTP